MSEKDVINEELARQELDGMIDYFEVDPEGQAWKDAEARLLRSIKRGRLSFDAGKGRVVQELVRPIELDNGGTLSRLEFKEPNAADLKVLDRYKDNEAMAKTLHLASRMTGQPVGVVERMAARDLTTLGAVTQLFF